MSEKIAKRSILVVDDEIAIAENYVRLFRLEGWSASCAFGGEQAVESIRKQSYDAVLLDMRMPNMDGFETLGKILEIRPNTCVIFFTAYGDVASAVRALRKGAWSMIIKGPLFKKEILPQVEDAVEKKIRLGKAEFDRITLIEKNARLDSVSTLAQGIAHQFGNRIAHIGARLNRIEFATELLEAQSYIPEIYKSLDVLTLSVRNLRQLSEAQQMSISEIDATPLIDRARYIAEKHHANHHMPDIIFKYEFTSKIVRVCSNEGFLVEAFECIISNAIESLILHGRGVITIRIDEEPQEAIFTFEDTGEGFSKEMLGRADLMGYTTKGKSGSKVNLGFGLTFVKAVVEQSGGRLEYGNRERGGASVRVHLPVQCESKQPKHFNQGE